MRQFCRGGIGRALRYRPVVDVDDLVQRSLQTAARLLPLYTSPARPPCSWLGMLHLDGRRDLQRELSQLDWLPADVAAAVALAEACGIERRRDPSATLAAVLDAAERLDQALPRVGAGPLDAALRAPALLEYEALASATVAGPDAVDHDAGQTAAGVARLVTDDAALIDQVVTGDPSALRRVGDQVVRRLGDRQADPGLVRRRCWEQFQRSGQLLASPTGRQRFAAAGESLTALDLGLQRAAGVARAGDDQ
jgi:hypothetical protein